MSLQDRVGSMPSPMVGRNWLLGPYIDGRSNMAGGGRIEEIIEVNNAGAAHQHDDPTPLHLCKMVSAYLAGIFGCRRRQQKDHRPP